jgi:hypothetical protein
MFNTGVISGAGNALNMIYLYVFLFQTGTTSGAEIVYASKARPISMGFVLLDLLFSVYGFVDHFLSLCTGNSKFVVPETLTIDRGSQGQQTCYSRIQSISILKLIYVYYSAS